ncbi:Rne/Rng family ribonuclease [Jiangella sp. DSM 45060]|uniref:Rne/Rng family ribonuclease n=1 Tax=Jiangella sp. DSM 45060 TaxID=1798224 RepID=UPI00087CBABE|nr:Rne/Rng family ribonuclease [Jiangella sp. DSM 45060]SDT47940.1 ribonuclease E [Jiangella sp. DSM 45060]
MTEETPGSSGDSSSTAPVQADATAEQAQPRRRRAASRAAGPPVGEPTLHDAGAPATSDDAPAAPARKTAKKAAAKKTAAKKTAKKAPAKKAASRKAAAAADLLAVDDPAADEAVPAAEPAAADTAPASAPAVEAGAAPAEAASAVADEAPAPRKRSRSRKAAQPAPEPLPVEAADVDDTGSAGASTDPNPAFAPSGAESAATEARASSVLFQAPAFSAAPLFAAPDPEAAEPVRGRRRAKPEPEPVAEETEEEPEVTTDASGDDDTDSDTDSDSDDDGTRRRRRRRGGRGRRRRNDDGSDASGDDDSDDDQGRDQSDDHGDDAQSDSDDDSADSDEGGSRRRRRRRRRRNDDGDEPRPDDPPNTVVRVRETRDLDDEVTSVKGSTRLEAKKQRRREGREAGRRRPPILSEAEFLARREAVDRVMAVRQSGDLTQIAVLEDDVLVEHYVSRASQQSLIGNVYLGRVQNVLPAMEAAFVDIGRGRNAVLYAGEVDWSGLGKNDGPKRIEDVLKSGQSVLVQVTKDPIGHKGARLTSQVSLPGRYVVYVPGGSMNGISRKLPDTERTRLKKILKQVVPEDAGVIVRTAAEGASEEELTNDVARLKAEWEALRKKSSGNAPQLLHGEPDLAIKVVRDLFNEDFTKLVVSGDRAWDTIEEYVSSVAGSLRDRVEKWTSTDDVFAAFRIDEQIAKAMDRKVWLPSGGSLVIDRTEAMTVVDVNTGKFTGSGGNLEETVTKNNLEAAEEIVRQLRLRDIGGIIVVDFIDMVLEANRDLVLRRLVECLGRDRTKHQVAEVTSLGLVQMTRKRIGTGLLEAFSEPCPHCKGRGLLVHAHPVESGNGGSSGGQSGSADDGRSSRSERRGRRRKAEQPAATQQPQPVEALTPKLEALASPGEASPADLMPVGANGNGGNGHGSNGQHGDRPAESAESAPAESAPAESAPAEPAATTAPAPATRRRRRAERAAGSTTTASGSTAAGSDSTAAGNEAGVDKAATAGGDAPAASADAAATSTSSTLPPPPPPPPAESLVTGAAQVEAAATGQSPASSSADAATTSSTDDAAEQKAEPARPRRTRRRAERPAGSPVP